MHDVLKKAAIAILQRRWWLERASYGPTDILSGQQGNDAIARLLAAGSAFAAGKIGGVELGAVRHYLRFAAADETCRHWGKHGERLFANAGVFPIDATVYSRFCKRFTQSLGTLDQLAVWFQPGENSIRKQFASAATPIALTALEPYLNDSPWSTQLAGRRILVVTPFAATVMEQYARRLDVWRSRPDVLPEFTLDTLRCPLSAALVPPAHKDWHSTLDSLCREMSDRAFDVAIIGAGAWGVPLASFAKSLGRVGIHLGGPTQVLFGILGARWDTHPVIKKFINGAWVRPCSADRPDNFRRIEDGCYW